MQLLFVPLLSGISFCLSTNWQSIYSRIFFKFSLIIKVEHCWINICEQVTVSVPSIRRSSSVREFILYLPVLVVAVSGLSVAPFEGPFNMFNRVAARESSRARSSRHPQLAHSTPTTLLTTVLSKWNRPTSSSDADAAPQAVGPVSSDIQAQESGPSARTAGESSNSTSSASVKSL